MDDIINFDPEAVLCPFCRKRRTTRLCDAPIGRQHWCGHPPRTVRIPGAGYWPWEKPMHVTLTCDRPISESCATRVGGEIDYCPLCIQRIEREARKHGKAD